LHWSFSSLLWRNFYSQSLTISEFGHLPFCHCIVVVIFYILHVSSSSDVWLSNIYSCYVGYLISVDHALYIIQFIIFLLLLALWKWHPKTHIQILCMKLLPDLFF
jgi:hypothetical protein